MSTTYAAKTDVSSGRSRDEIERTLARYGAESFAYGWDRERAMVGFVARERQMRFLLPMPDRADFRLTPSTRVRRSPAAIEAAYEQAVKARWRALALVIKAKLQAVESGIVTFEQEFAMHVVLPDGSTVGDHVMPAIAESYETGEVAPLLGQLQGRKPRIELDGRVE